MKSKFPDLCQTTPPDVLMVERFSIEVRLFLSKNQGHNIVVKTVATYVQCREVSIQGIQDCIVVVTGDPASNWQTFHQANQPMRNGGRVTVFLCGNWKMGRDSSALLRLAYLPIMLW